MKTVLLVNPFDKIPGEEFREQRYTYLYHLLKNITSIRWISSDFHHWTHRKREIGKVPLEDRENILLVPMWAYKYNLGLRRFVSYLIYSFRAMWSIVRLSPKPDVILCMAPPELMFMLALFSRYKRIRYIVDILDLWPDLFLKAFPNSLKCLGRYILSPYFLMSYMTCRQASHITSVSETYTKWAMERGRRKDENCSYYYLGCAKNIDNYSFRKPRDRLLCLFAGQFGYNYDVETIIKSAEIVEGRIPGKVVFYLAGSGYKLQDCKKSAGDLGNVKFLGWISQEELRQLVPHCHLGLSSYIKGASQSMPTKIFDYMSYGLFIVNSLPGEPARLIEREGIGTNYEAGNSQELAEKLIALWNDIDEVIKIGFRSWELSINKYSAEYIYRRMVRELILGS